MKESKGAFGTVKNLAAATGLTIMLTACESLPTLTTQDAHTGESKMSNCTKGALGGAILGAIFDDDKRGRGAIVGGLAGCGAGHYFDLQEEKLREKLQGTGVSVTRVDDDTIQLNMPGNVTFGTNSSDVSAEFYPTLNSVAEVLREFDETNVTIEGHTDSSGSDSYNLTLSQERANSVKGYLDAQDGVAGNRLQAVGFGETQLVTGADGQEDPNASRRVEIEIDAQPGN